MEESKRSELEQGSIGTILIKYAAPSVISMLFFGLQSLIDGIVVGNYIGDKALGGINIILPLFSVLMVVAYGRHWLPDSRRTRAWSKRYT